MFIYIFSQEKKLIVLSIAKNEKEEKKKRHHFIFCIFKVSLVRRAEKKKKRNCVLLLLPILQLFNRSTKRERKKTLKPNMHLTSFHPSKLEEKMYFSIPRKWEMKNVSLPETIKKFLKCHQNLKKVLIWNLKLLPRKVEESFCFIS